MLPVHVAGIHGLQAIHHDFRPGADCTSYRGGSRSANYKRDHRAICIGPLESDPVTLWHSETEADVSREREPAVPGVLAVRKHDARRGSQPKKSAVVECDGSRSLN